LTASNRPSPTANKTLKWSVAAGAALAGIAAYRYIRRRGDPATPCASDDRRRPSWGKLLAEFPAAGRLVAAQFAPPPVADPELGQGRAVLVIPGFLAHDGVTIRLRRTLAACGFVPFGWANGINLGFRENLFEKLEERLDQVIEQAGGPVILVGWSLGGLYARELAKLRAADVSRVVTLGSPFSVDLRDNNAWKLYELINDHPVDGAPVDVDVATKPPVPTTAIWSEKDGIVAPASASGKPIESDTRLKVATRHNELVSHPQALKALVATLAEPADA
jgi:hypothetical protein